MNITNSEKDVLNLMWEVGKPLTSSEIVNLSEGKSWKPSYINIMINSLIKKKMIVISGFKKTTKNFARTFSPAVSKEKFAFLQIVESLNPNDDVYTKLILMIMENVKDKEKVFEAVESFVRQQKKV